MPTVDLNMGSVGKVPEGYFRLSVDKAIYKSNKTKDGKIINLQMSLIDMPDEFEDFENTKVFETASFKPTGLWRVQEVLRAFTGDPWDEDNLSLEIDEDGNVECLQDATAIGLIYADDSYQNRVQPKVKSFFVDDGSIELGANSEED